MHAVLGISKEITGTTAVTALKVWPAFFPFAAAPSFHGLIRVNMASAGFPHAVWQRNLRRKRMEIFRATSVVFFLHNKKECLRIFVKENIAKLRKY